MLFNNKLVTTDEVEIEGHAYPVQYFETQTVRRTLRYSAGRFATAQTWCWGPPIESFSTAAR
jgi:hypothetical protein